MRSSVALVLALTACGTAPADGGGDDDDGGDDPDAAPGELALTPTGEVALVVGPQGADMFVMTARTSGIRLGDPGNIDDPTHAFLAITLARGDLDVGFYSGNTLFVDDGAGGAVATEIWLVVNAPRDLVVGLELTARAELTDADGTARIGTATLIATE